MSNHGPSEDEFYRHLISDLEEDENPAYDHVGSVAMWVRYKRALERWIAEKDAEWNDIAMDKEHGRER